MAFHFTQEVNGGETNSMVYLYCAGPLAECGDGDSGKWKGISAFYGVTYYNTRCWYDDQDGVYEPTPIFHVIQRAVRVVYFTQP
ncbi:MAG TPA: hypothetical protein VNK95_03275 [Caldilineaceae bacterium]|nr:hypothetical protein [Caldilineaceae bacterium]